VANKNLIEDIARSAADTDICRAIIRGAAPAFIDSWAGSNPFKRLVAWFVSKSITKSFVSKEKRLPPPENKTKSAMRPGKTSGVLSKLLISENLKRPLTDHRPEAAHIYK
jgi:hypothetical protein